MRLLLSLLLLLSSQTSFATRLADSSSSSPHDGAQPQHRRRQQLKVNSRIIGGSDVVPSDRYPFFAFVLSDLESSGAVPCGGTLIHPDIILTAASCVQSESIDVVVNLSDFDDTTGSIPRTVMATKIHPDFVSATLENDVALLLLDSPITDVALGNLNDDSRVPSEAEDVTVIGFGSLSEEEFDPSRVLQSVVLQVSDFEACNEAYEGLLKVDEQLCAGVEEGGKVCLYGMWYQSTDVFDVSSRHCSNLTHVFHLT
jgi:secreted trypsin-like serine protease